MASEKKAADDKPNPAQEVTLPFDAAQVALNRETAMNRSPGAETIREPQSEKVPAQPSPAGPGPIQESTLQQDERDQISAQESSVSKEAPPQVVGYHLEEKLGQGTYGVVWRAMEINTNKKVAIKFFHRRVGEMWQIVWAEIKQLALLDAVPGIIQLKDAEPDGTPPYFIMNYAEGGSLGGLVREGPVPVPRALEIFRNMIEAMAYVHAKGIRHCDLKPANILLDALGKPLIADFGQAHLSLESQASSVNLGTFYYMAPEQADLTKQIPDTRWDVYGLGAIFYCLLTGTPPRATTELSNELNQTVHLGSRLQRYQEGVEKAPPPTAHRKLPGMDRSLSDIIEKCLHLNPVKRFQNASEILQALDRRERYLRKRPMLLLGLAASLLLVLCLGGVAYSLVHHSVQKTQETLQSQILKNDKTTAHLIGNVIRHELSNRKDTLERLAKNVTLVQKVKAFREELKSETIKNKHYMERPGFRALEDHFYFNSYRPGLQIVGYYDLEGRLLVGGYPEKDKSNIDMVEQAKHKKSMRSIYGNSYRHRDYYHGKGRHFTPEDTARYVGRTYVSEPYVSTLIENEEPVKLIAISTPLFDLIPDSSSGELTGKQDRSKPLGILVGFIRLDELHSWLENVRLANGCAMLVNQNGVCVYHSSNEETDAVLKEFPTTFAAIQRHASGQEETYHDEVTKRECLASFAQASNVEWGAVVLHYRDEVFAPIQDLRWSMLKVIFVGAGVSAILLACVWVWLLRTMRGKDRLKTT